MTEQKNDFLEKIMSQSIDSALSVVNSKDLEPKADSIVMMAIAMFTETVTNIRLNRKPRNAYPEQAY